MASYGRVGIFLAAETNRLYGVTSKHVTTQSSDMLVYLRKENRNFVKFGKVKEISSMNINHDVSIFEINVDICHKLFSNNVNEKWNSKSQLLMCNSENLYGSFVRTKGLNETGIVHFAIAQVATRQEHTENDINTEVYFLVKPVTNYPFIQPGDSGNVVSIQKTDVSYTYYMHIGLIIGKFENRITASALKSADENSKQYVLCLNLKHAFETLKNVTNLKLNAVVPAYQNNGVLKENGMKLWIKTRTVQCISRGDFDLPDHLINLIFCIKETVSQRPGMFWTENTYMLRLSQFVNSRNDLEPSGCVTADHKCYLHAILGCDFLFSEKYDLAEHQLKKATTMIAATSSPYRLLCKMITYITWLLFKQKKLIQMRNVLYHGFNFMLRFKEHDVRIHDSIGYIYFDLSRYLIATRKPQKALRMAYKSLEYFESFQRDGRTSLEKQALAWSLIARLSLNCGEFFERIHQEPIDLSKASLYIIMLERNLDNLPTVQQVCYYMVKTDFFYRQGYITEAIKSARISVEMSQENVLCEELLKSSVRLRYLKTV
ncbi:uncharacterized protein [Mytilus edulis]|uniref:uncharacterized protein n=1 Tax=Mytilus edulis TaxID=6550 RepID=UPI0039EE84FE